MKSKIRGKEKLFIDRLNRLISIYKHKRVAIFL